MKTGETLEIWADDPAAKRDIQSLAKRLGIQVLSFKENDGKFIFLLKKLSKEE